MEKFSQFRDRGRSHLMLIRTCADSVYSDGHFAFPPRHDASLRRLDIHPWPPFPLPPAFLPHLRPSVLSLLPFPASAGHLSQNGIMGYDGDSGHMVGGPSA